MAPTSLSLSLALSLTHTHSRTLSPTRSHSHALSLTHSLSPQVLKWVSDGLILHDGAYLRDSWNWLDFIIVLVRFRAKREQLKRFYGLLPESHGQNLALTVLYVRYSLGFARMMAPTSATRGTGSTSSSSWYPQTLRNFPITENRFLFLLYYWPTFSLILSPTFSPILSPTFSPISRNFLLMLVSAAPQRHLRELAGLN